MADIDFHLSPCQRRVTQLLLTNRQSFGRTSRKRSTPSGHSLSSSSYNQGRFFLHLATPVPGGKYRCHVPTPHLHFACLTPGVTDQAKVKGSVEVDPLLTTVLIVEARQKTLTQHIVQLKHQDGKLNEMISALREDNVQLKNQVGELMKQNSDLKEEVSQLEKIDANLTQECTSFRQEVGKLKTEDSNLREEINKLKMADNTLLKSQNYLNKSLTKEMQDTVKESAQLCSQCSDVVRDGDYVLAFRLTPRIGQSAYDTYVKVGHNDDDPLVRSRLPAGCLTVDGSQHCDRHYRSKVLDLWAKLNVQKVRLVVYKNKMEVSYFEFNAVKADYINWFSADRVTGTSYTDFFSQPKNYCSIEGVTHNSDARRFFINRNYGGCPKDAGWLVVTDNVNGCRSVWGPDPPSPAVGYSLGNTYHLWSDHKNVRFDADVMAIWVKMATMPTQG